MRTDKCTILKIGKTEYTVGHGIGAWAKSCEKKARHGEVRYIGGVLMYAYSVDRISIFLSSIYCVSWSPVDDDINNYHNLRLWVSTSYTDSYATAGFIKNSEMRKKGGQQEPCLQKG